MKTLTILRNISLALLLMLSNAVIADQAGTSNNLLAIQKDWAVANYQLKGKAQESAFNTLISKADGSVSQHPGDVELLIWAGIIKSSHAGVKGGLGALGLAKAAKKDLEAAMAIDENALSGSALTSLGTLYRKVPGWPLGFGNKKKAEALLKQALQVNPDGIDSNYFYADYLIDNKDYNQAKQHLQKALRAEPRVGRDIADQGRRQEIQAALTLLAEKS